MSTEQQPQMSDELAARSDVAAIEYGKANGKEIEQQFASPYDTGADLTDAHEAGQGWMYRKFFERKEAIDPMKLVPGISAEAIIQICQLNNTCVADYEKALFEAEQKIKALHPLPPSPVGEAVAFAEWIHENCFIVYSEQGKWWHVDHQQKFFTTAEMYAMFAATQPNPSRAGEISPALRWPPNVIFAAQWEPSARVFDFLQSYGMKWKAGPMGNNSFYLVKGDEQTEVRPGNWVVMDANEEFYRLEEAHPLTPPPEVKEEEYRFKEGELTKLLYEYQQKWNDGGGGYKFFKEGYRLAKSAPAEPVKDTPIEQEEFTTGELNEEDWTAPTEPPADVPVNLPSGARAMVSPDASPELLNALDTMVQLAKDRPDAQGEIPAEMEEWMLVEADRNFVKGDYHDTAVIFMRVMYRKMQEEIEDMRIRKESFERIAAKIIKEADAHISKIISLTDERDRIIQALQNSIDQVAILSKEGVKYREGLITIMMEAEKRSGFWASHTAKKALQNG